MTIENDTAYFSGFPKPWYLMPPAPLEKLEPWMDLELMLDAQLGLMHECELHNIPQDLLFYMTLGNIAGEASEAGEFFGDITKPWKKDFKFDSDHAKEELIDILHFLLQAFLILGMDANEIYKLYIHKNRKNFQRIMEKRRESKGV